MEIVLDDPGLTVRVDRQLLSMILVQYIDNARKYFGARNANPDCGATQSQ